MHVYKILESFYCPQLSTANMGYWSPLEFGIPKDPKRSKKYMCPTRMLCLGHSLRTSTLMEVLCPAVVGVGGAGAFAHQ